MGKSLGILNNIRHNASQEYQNRIPVATQENIASIGNALQTYTVLYNEFCDALINKIGKTILESKLFSNRLARFKQGAVLNQQDVEEIFIEMAKAEGAYDPAGPNPLGRREGPDVKAIYHRQNRQDVYCISIGDIDFVRVFRSEATLDSFIAGLINSVYSGASYDEWLAMKNLINTYDGYTVVGVSMDPEINGTFTVNKETLSGVVKALRKLARDVTFPSRDGNKAGVMTWSDPSKMVFLANKDLLAELDVEVLAHAFTQGKTDVPFEIIPMDDFGDLCEILTRGMEGTDIFGTAYGHNNPHSVLGLLVDEDFLRVFDTLSHFEPQRNAHGLFTNYFYHVHQILSASTFKNAYALIAGVSN